MTSFRITTQTTYLVEAERLGDAVDMVEQLNHIKPPVEIFDNERFGGDSGHATIVQVTVIGAGQSVSHG